MDKLRIVTPADVKRAQEIEAAWQLIRDADFDQHADQAIAIVTDEPQAA